ncbi:hypothetical protein [Bacillus coahuilensis]|uniref:hypothetical protein n=1 Tax=Bacillus coahuilensis TaxID=408580 RepID=UPI0001850EB0|nr:hypothetical protein [Bacillus coahuilensis]
MKKRNASIFSAVFFIISVFPIVVGLTEWGNPLYVAVLNISIFFPLMISIVGFIFAFIGIGGKVKISLVVLNAIGSILSSFLILYRFLWLPTTLETTIYLKRKSLLLKKN